MLGLGLSCNVSSGRVTVRGVSIANGVAEEVFVHRTAAEDEALQLRTLADALLTRLADLSPSTVVVRASDHHHNARLTDAAALRLKAEGVLLATARARVPLVVGLSGRSIGETCGSTKAKVEAQARGLVDNKTLEAACAALAANQLASADLEDGLIPPD